MQVKSILILASITGIMAAGDGSWFNFGKVFNKKNTTTVSHASASTHHVSATHVTAHNATTHHVATATTKVIKTSTASSTVACNSSTPTNIGQKIKDYTGQVKNKLKDWKKKIGDKSKQAYNKTKTAIDQIVKPKGKKHDDDDYYYYSSVTTTASASNLPTPLFSIDDLTFGVFKSDPTTTESSPVATATAA